MKQNEKEYRPSLAMNVVGTILIYGIAVVEGLFLMIGLSEDMLVGIPILFLPIMILLRIYCANKCYQWSMQKDSDRESWFVYLVGIFFNLPFLIIYSFFRKGD